MQALTAAEAVSGAKHIRVAPVLLLLADLYARTRRVTLAEGLYRFCLQLAVHVPDVQELAISLAAKSQCIQAEDVCILLSYKCIH